MRFKKIFFLNVFALLFFSMAFSQPPQKMSYQAVVRDANNQLAVNQQIGVKVSIIKHAMGGVAVYEELHQVTTNSNGLFSLQVGTGTPSPGTDFSTIDWGIDNYYIKSEIDLTGGQNYSIVGTEQLISVPYALYAGGGNYLNLDNRPPDGTRDGDILYWSTTDSAWHILPPGSTGQVLTMGPNGIPLWYTQSFNNNFPPTITTDSIFDFTGTTTHVDATIVDQGTTGIIASGVCWSSTNPYPSLGNNHTSDGSGIGSFTSFITNLTPNTMYYIRAYATNSIGTSYGAPLSFVTPSNCGTVTDWDGNQYATVYIGNQCWMKENLRTKHYSNGVAINKGALGSSGHAGYYFIYDEDTSNVSKHGLLYTWTAIMNGAGASTNNPSGIQGICPSGWHLPSHAEWCELENYLEPGIDGSCSTSGYRGTMAKKMVLPQYWSSYPSNSFAPGYWHNDTAEFNTSEFSATPGGRYERYYHYSGYSYNYESFDGLNNYGFWWSCTSTGSYQYRYRQIAYSETGINSGITTSNSDYSYAMSVRCLKN